MRQLLFDIPCREPEEIYEEGTSLTFNGDYEVKKIEIHSDRIVIYVQTKVNSKEQIANIKQQDERYLNQITNS